MNEDYWSEFYKSHPLEQPSSFARFILPYLSQSSVILEFGCGSGRDAVFFAGNHSIPVFASDRANEGWERTVEAIRGEAFHNLVTFATVDLSDSGEVREKIREVVGIHEKSNFVAYARFLLHSIDAHQEENFFAGIASTVPEAHLVCLEYRTIEDQKIPKVFSGHSRRYINHSQLVEDVTKSGYEVLFQGSGVNLAPYRDENPFVGRLIAKKIAEK